MTPRRDTRASGQAGYPSGSSLAAQALTTLYPGGIGNLRTSAPAVRVEGADEGDDVPVQTYRVASGTLDETSGYGLALAKVRASTCDSPAPAAIPRETSRCWVVCCLGFQACGVPEALVLVAEGLRGVLAAEQLRSVVVSPPQPDSRAPSR